MQRRNNVCKELVFSHLDHAIKISLIQMSRERTWLERAFWNVLAVSPHHSLPYLTHVPDIQSSILFSVYHSLSVSQLAATCLLSFYRPTFDSVCSNPTSLPHLSTSVFIDLPAPSHLPEEDIVHLGELVHYHCASYPHVVLVRNSLQPPPLLTFVFTAFIANVYTRGAFSMVANLEMRTGIKVSNFSSRKILYGLISPAPC